VTVGFVITPDAIKDQIAALDNAIALLDGDVRAQSKLSNAWRTEWDAFVRRWTIERDSYASWSSRLFATYAVPRVESFLANYKWWARDYQKKTGARAPLAAPAESETMTMALIPTPVWWILGIGGGLYLYSLYKGARR
jgi:hypothetical protein